MSNLQENIVSSVNQNIGDFFIQRDGNGPRILFVGNSITKHGPSPQIGWYNDNGMAASCPEKDYVHLILSELAKENLDPACAILQVANFERGFDGFVFGDDYKAARDFKPDVIFFYFGANVLSAYDDGTGDYKISFMSAVENLYNYLSPDHKIRLIISAGFYIRPKLDDEKRSLCRKLGCDFVEMDDIQNDPETHGLFNHPNDLGMERIAKRFLPYIKKYI